MNGACAICQGLITRGTQFVLIGTEAVHRSCASTGRPTQLQQYKRRVTDLQVQAARLESKAAELERELRRRSARAAQQAREEQASSEAYEDLTRELAAFKQRAAAAQALLEGQVRALQSRLAILTEPVAADSDSTPEEDPSVERFRLLEFT